MNNQDKITEEVAVQVLRKNWQRLMAADGVTSCGVGYEIRDGRRTGNICIQCSVERKYALEDLAEKDLIPLPDYVEDEGLRVQVDVVERKFLPSFELESEEQVAPPAIDFPKLRKSRLDALQPGASISHIDGSAGTIGAIVFDEETGQPRVLSNWHVLQGPGAAIGDEIVQPGPHDETPRPENLAGRLERSHLRLAGDCATASIEGRDWKESLIELNVAPRRIATANLDDLVVKSGRTTGVTYGIVSRVNVVARINYGGDVGKRDIGGFEIRPNPEKMPDNGEISMGGDSGSIWLIDDDGENRDIVVGLHFAGETSADDSDEHALACKITSVCEKLKITFEPAEQTTAEEGELWREVFARLEAMEAAVQSQAPCTCGAPTSVIDDPQAVAAAEAGVPVHGNWCGPGHGGGTPRDSVDAACMAHDKCYDRDGYLNCDCDRKLVRELDRVLSNGQLSPTLRNKARAMRQFFAASSCTRYVKIGGRRVPLPASNAANNAGRAINRAAGNVSRTIRRWF